MTSYCECKRPTGEPGESCSVCGFLVPKPGVASDAPPPGVMRVPQEEIQVQHTNKTVVLYVCPTPDCPSVTAITDPAEKLEEIWSGPKTENKAELQMRTGSPYTHNRAECPFCKVKGTPVQRVRMLVPVSVPVVGPSTPTPPPGSGKLHAQPVRQPEG